jgi:hypothetical protein
MNSTVCDCTKNEILPCLACRNKSLMELVKFLARSAAEKDYNALIKKQNRKETKQ